MRSPGIVIKGNHGSGARGIVHVHAQSRRCTGAIRRGDVRAADVDEIRPESSDRVLAYVGDRQRDAESEQEYSD